MRKILLLITVLMLVLPLQAQDQKQVHVVMKDGTYYRHATLIEITLDYVLISLKPRDEQQTDLRLTLPVAEIQRIKYLDKEKDSKIRVEEELKRDERIYYNLEMGVLAGRSNEFESHESYPLVKGAIGYQYKNYLGAGIGIGLDSYGFFSTMPVFLDIRGTILDSRVTPFYYLQAGYAKAWFTDDNGTPFIDREIDASWNINPGIGVQFRTGDVDLVVSLGYKQQKVKISEFTEWGNDTINRRKMNRVTFGFGVIF